MSLVFIHIQSINTRENTLLFYIRLRIKISLYLYNCCNTIHNYKWQIPSVWNFHSGITQATYQMQVLPWCCAQSVVEVVRPTLFHLQGLRANYLKHPHPLREGDSILSDQPRVVCTPWQIREPSPSRPIQNVLSRKAPSPTPALNWKEANATTTNPYPYPYPYPLWGLRY